MTVFDDLTHGERQLIVAALECAPTHDNPRRHVDEDTNSDSCVAADDAVLQALADRIRASAIADEAEKLARAFQEVADRQVVGALVSQVGILEGLCDQFAGALGRIAAMWADSDEQPVGVDAVQQALLLWQEAKAHVRGLLEAVEGG